jgi:hypothetical protein
MGECKKRLVLGEEDGRFKEKIEEELTKLMECVSNSVDVKARDKFTTGYNKFKQAISSFV